LPEAQLDRFMFQVDVSYPSADEEFAIVKQQTSAYRPVTKKVLSPERILNLQELVLRVPVADHVVRYAVALVRATRPAESNLQFITENVAFGAGPRASQYLILGAKAKAILEGRPAAAVEDVRALARPTLQHRIITNFHAEAEGIKTQALIDRLLQSVRP
jgi:MoxR-like ATPase